MNIKSLKEIFFLASVIIIGTFQNKPLGHDSNIFELKEYLNLLPIESRMLANGSHILKFYYPNFNYFDLRSLNKSKRGFYTRDNYILIDIQDDIVSGAFDLIVISNNSNYISEDFDRLESYGYIKKSLEGYNLFFKNSGEQ